MKKKKTKIYHFRVSGHPRGRQEPRAGVHSWYTPAKTKKYYEWIRACFQQLYPRLNDRTHRWKVSYEIYVRGKKFPDNDNVSKGVSDALQGCIWHNDSQIWDGPYPKRISVKDKKDECVVVRAEMMEE